MLETIFGGQIEAPEAWWQGPARLALAVLLGGVVGVEREAKGRVAGLRTYMMVALGSAGFALVAMEMLAWMMANAPDSAGHALRVVSAIVGGIGFLGAGAIIQSGGQVRGLTTAAGMWVIASVGAAAGVGLPGIAAAVAGLALVIFLATVADAAAREMGGEAGKNDG